MATTITSYKEALTRPFELGKDLPDVSRLPTDGPVVVVFAPHPDDECIVGTLPLVLKRELHARVINVAVTLGSNVARQKPRVSELTAACKWLGFELHIANYAGVLPDTREQQPEQWEEMVTSVASLISGWQADVLFFPHAHDYHPAHIATHHLVEEALGTLPDAMRPHCVWTEFWHPMAQPNLMVECSESNLGLLLKALSCHEGEVARNPYHMRLPAWMIDNTRRGAEVIGGKGANAPDMLFSTLYRWIAGNNKSDLLSQLKTRIYNSKL